MTARVIHADCLDAMREMPDACVDAIVTDPPYGLSFMGRNWDHGVPGPAFWIEALRVAKPGAHLVAFGGTRTYHRLACAIEDAGWEVRDCLSWLYGCLSEDTEILINGVWVHYRSAVEGSLALCYDAENDTFSQQPVEQLFVYDYDDTAYRIESERTDQVVSRNHRCLVWRDGRWDFVLAEEVAREQEARVPVLEAVSDVLDAISLLQPNASGSQQAVRGLPGEATKGTPQSAPVVRESTCDKGVIQGQDKVYRLRQEGVETAFVVEEGKGVVLLPSVQREVTGRGVGEARAQGLGSGEPGGPSVCRCEDDRPAQSGVEGRGHNLQEARELYGRAVRSVPAGVPSNGAEGRLCDGAPSDRGEGAGSLSPSDGDGASRGPRPDEQLPGELGAVQVESGSQAVRAPRFTTSDLARITPFHLTGKVWCVKVPTGAFVARRNGKVFVTGNSGFPKSLDVSKAIDKLDATDEQKRRRLKFTEWVRSTGATARQIDEATGTRMGNHYTTHLTQPAIMTREHLDACRHLLGDVPEWVERECEIRSVESANFASRKVLEMREMRDTQQVRIACAASAAKYNPAARAIVPLTAPATDAARAWQGWGTALKPAWEPCILARKPLVGTVAANVLTHGTGALNIDATRIASGGEHMRHGTVTKQTSVSGDDRSDSADGMYAAGASFTPTNHAGGRWPANVALDEEAAAMLGEPARFFYTAKASRSERNDGCDAIEARPQDPTRDADAPGGNNPRNRGAAPRVNSHPTVKPVALMRWLVRMVTPPGGVVLDPFCGSGTTLVAAIEEGFDCIGIEREAEYVAIIEARVAAAQQRPQRVAKPKPKRQPVKVQPAAKAPPAQIVSAPLPGQLALAWGAE